jgi:hypothetical protein
LHSGRRSRTYNIFPLYGLTTVGRNTHLGPVLGFKSLQRRHLLNLLRQDSEWRDRAAFNGHPDLIPAVNLLMQSESGRQSCLKIDLFSGDGVLEFQKLGVQEISSIAGEAGEIFKRLAG